MKCVLVDFPGKRWFVWFLGGYVLLGLGWLLVTHGIPHLLDIEPFLRNRLEIVLDLILILTSAALLGLVIRHYRKQISRRERDLHVMIQEVCAVSGEKFFQSLVLHLAEALQADYAFICEFLEDDPTQVRTVAVCADGEMIENFNFPLINTPCHRVVTSGPCSIPEGVLQKFPLDHLAVQLEVEGYVGMPLTDSRGQVMGPMAIFSRRPIQNPRLAETMLRLFVTRAAAELERRRVEKTVDYMSSYDPLTGLPNRDSFHAALEATIPSLGSEGVAVLILDLDRFKTINDSLGHTTGDLVLQGVAERLRGMSHHQEVLARFSGDSFMILLHGEEEDGIALVAAKMIQSLRAPFQIGGHELHVDSSIGIAVFPGDGQDADTLLKNADTALNRAKTLGPGNYRFYTADMNARFLRQLGLENQLRRALERNEFLLYFQPQYELFNQQPFGLEALLRWQHPENGLVPPDEFIPLAEETGLIESVGSWVLEQTCRQFRQWEGAGMAPGKVAVNLSGRQFQQPDLLQVIRRVLEESGIPPQRLELEITENVLMQDVGEAIDKLSTLRNLGVRIAIDDFGTGYSSLAFLKKLPVDTLKIDRSFVWDTTQDSDGAAIVKAIIAMARSLDLQVVAEGVETRPQLDFLRRENCQFAQGYFLSPPMLATSCEALLSA